MMKIYCILVPEYHYDEYDSDPAKIIYATSDKEKAEKYFRECNEYNASIEEIELD